MKIEQNDEQVKVQTETGYQFIANENEITITKNKENHTVEELEQKEGQNVLFYQENKGNCAIIFIDSLPSIDLHGYDKDSARVKVLEFINDNKIMKNDIICMEKSGNF